MINKTKNIKLDKTKIQIKDTNSNKTRQDKTRQDKTRQDKTRQDKTRQDKTRQDETRQDMCTALLRRGSSSIPAGASKSISIQ